MIIHFTHDAIKVFVSMPINGLRKGGNPRNLQVEKKINKKQQQIFQQK